MADDKTKRGASDRKKVNKNEGYEVRYFAKKHGITVEQAKALIEKHGNDRATLNKAAEKLIKG
ncbi:MAG TPA: DUF3606 domain-containing protein [Sedimentisphaerales bacterium]|nr:DUF3606 domain-containing protein [Sedimentisphaerales bacterium]